MGHWGSVREPSGRARPGESSPGRPFALQGGDDRGPPSEGATVDSLILRCSVSKHPPFLALEPSISVQSINSTRSTAANVTYTQ